MSWLAGERDTSVAQTVTYRRGTLSVVLSVTFGRSILKVYDAHGGVKVERTEKDIIVTAASLDFGGGPVQPQRGDLVEWTTPGGQTLRYEIMATDKEAGFRRADPWGVSLRIHLKFKQVL